MSLPEIRNLLAGTPGSTLNVEVVRARKAEPQKVVITRDVVSIPRVSDKMMDDGIGYIKVEALTKGKVAGSRCRRLRLWKSLARRKLCSTFVTVPRETRRKESPPRISS